MLRWMEAGKLSRGPWWSPDGTTGDTLVFREGFCVQAEAGLRGGQGRANGKAVSWKTCHDGSKLTLVLIVSVIFVFGEILPCLIQR